MWNFNTSRGRYFHLLLSSDQTLFNRWEEGEIIMSFSCVFQVYLFRLYFQFLLTRLHICKREKNYIFLFSVHVKLEDYFKFIVHARPGLNVPTGHVPLLGALHVSRETAAEWLLIRQKGSSLAIHSLQCHVSLQYGIARVRPPSVWCAHPDIGGPKRERSTNNQLV